VLRIQEQLVKLGAFCRAHGGELAAVVASGGYEKLPFGLRWAGAIPCAIVNPPAVRRFAEDMSILGREPHMNKPGLLSSSSLGSREPAASAA
jgi:transposase